MFMIDFQLHWDIIHCGQDTATSSRNTSSSRYAWHYEKLLRLLLDGHNQTFHPIRLHSFHPFFTMKVLFTTSSQQSNNCLREVDRSFKKCFRRCWFDLKIQKKTNSVVVITWSATRMKNEFLKTKKVALTYTLTYARHPQSQLCRGRKRFEQ